MRFRTLLLLLILAALSGFIALNWAAFLTPTLLSIGFSTVEAPLGIVMLGVVGVLALVFTAFLFYLQTSVMLETRRHAKEQHTNRKLADVAEASRFTDLRIFLGAELKSLAAAHEASHAALLTRIAALERDLFAAVEQSGNSLSACIGELDDRMTKPPVAS